MKTLVRVYAVYGFLGDQLQFPIQQVCFGGKEDSFIVADFLSEDTYQILRKLKTDYFYDPFLKNLLSVAVLRSIQAKRLKFVCNAGALNPKECAEKMAGRLKELGIPLKVGYIEGCNLAEAMDDFGWFPHSKSAKPLIKGRTKDIISATVYIGSEKIACLLKGGADIVIAGRVTDAGMTLGCLASVFPWQYGRDWDLLAKGIVAGHMLSCGGQSVRPVHPAHMSNEELARIAYPYVDVDQKGNIVVGSESGISEESVISQLFYGIPDTKYIDPDVIVDLAEIEVSQIDRHQVALSGIKGIERPERLRAIVLLKTGVYAMTGILQIGNDHFNELGGENVREIIRLRIAVGGVLLEPKDIQVQVLGVSATDTFLQVFTRFSSKAYAMIAKSQLPSLIVSGFNGSYGNIPQVDEEIEIWDALIARDSVEKRLEAGYLS